MPRESYIKTNDDEFNAQLTTFANTIGNYVAVLGLDLTLVAAQADDAAYFKYVLTRQNMMRNATLQATTWKDTARFGGAASITGEPATPTFPAPVAPVAPGIEPRFRALAQSIKTNANSNEAMWDALGINGPEQTGPDLSTIQPLIGVKITGGEVAIKWGFAGHRDFLSSCEIQVNRGDGQGMVLLTIDTTPNYNDTTPFPATPTKWTYRAIYHVGDHRVGQWSSPVSVTVGG